MVEKSLFIDSPIYGLHCICMSLYIFIFKSAANFCSNLLLNRQLASLLHKSFHLVKLENLHKAFLHLVPFSMSNQYLTGIELSSTGITVIFAPSHPVLAVQVSLHQTLQTLPAALLESISLDSLEPGLLSQLIPFQITAVQFGISRDGRWSYPALET